MKAGVIYFGILLAFLACVYGAEKIYYDVDDAPKLYVQYKKDFNKVYTDDLNLLVHYEAFKKTLGVINESNRKSKSAIFGLTNFADYTAEELKHTKGFGPID